MLELFKEILGPIVVFKGCEERYSDVATIMELLRHMGIKVAYVSEKGYIEDEWWHLCDFYVVGKNYGHLPLTNPKTNRRVFNTSNSQDITFLFWK